jgi:hypothetical protein
MSWEAIILATSGIVGLMGSTGVLVWFVSSQFSINRSLMYDGLREVTKTIMEKLEYHEKHDDDRFHEISDRIWGLEVRNAAKDGVLPVDHRRKQSQ